MKQIFLQSVVQSQLLNRQFPVRRPCKVVLLIVTWLAASCIEGPAIGCSQQVAPDRLKSGVDFETEIAPIFQRRCLSCHNGNEDSGGFNLTSAETFLESGQVELGDASASNLLELITPHNGRPPEMPQDAEPLSKQDRDLLAKWIDQGAMWPVDFLLQPTEIKDFQWWSLQPITQLPVPTIDGINNPVDAFVLRKLRAIGLKQNPQAGPRDLLRRLSYDLTGLPPSSSDLQNFADDPSPANYQDFVEKYLASPRYGERWGRHWLDLVRYADTCGYDKDKLRPNAWPYRDYVIRSFNQDKPYEQFVKEQLAGDYFYPDTKDGIVGLGFVAAGPWDFIGHVEVSETKLDGKEARNLDRDEMVSATFNTFCSTTVQCARCHNHKFDPITQQHYYNLQSVFAAIDRADRMFESDPDVAQQRRRLIDQRSDLRKQLARWNDRVLGEISDELRTEIAEVQSKTVALKPINLHPEYGYHSQISPTPNTEKWLELKWDQAVQISKIVIYPCYDDFGGIGAGFGFPQSWEMSIVNADHQTQTIYQADSMRRKQALPVVISLEDLKSVSRLRLTATRLATRQDDYHLAISELEVFDEQGRNVAVDAKLTSLDSIEAPVRWRLQNICDGLYPAYAKLQTEQLSPLLERVRKAEAQAFEAVEVKQRSKIEQRIHQCEQQLNRLPAPQWVYAATTDFSPNGNFLPTKGEPREVKVLTRGNIAQPSGPTNPGTIPLSADNLDALLALGSAGDSVTEADHRAALANWIIDRENPLTWRSIVNRIWLHHFDHGLVSTPNDFGRMGQPPTHPELLDWLASNFRDNGQSIKDLHRLIVTSQTYKQSTDIHANGLQTDQDNQYYWRANRRKLSAEELRDSILEISGQLNLEMGGPGYYLFELQKPEHSPHYEYHLFDPDDVATHRRTVYRFVVRSQPDPLMATFDCADSSQSVPQRDQTLTALQALSLMNNKFTLVMAEHFATRLQEEASSLGDQVELGFKLVTGRTPTPQESAAIAKYGQQHGLTNVCRVLFNLNEFIFVD